MKRILIYELAGILLCLGYFIYLEMIFAIDILTRLSYYLSDGGYLLLFGIFIESATNLFESFLVVMIPMIFPAACMALAINILNSLFSKRVMSIDKWSGFIINVLFLLLLDLILAIKFLPHPGSTYLSVPNYKIIQFWSIIGLPVYAVGSLLLEFLITKKKQKTVS